MRFYNERVEASRNFAIKYGMLPDYHDEPGMKRIAEPDGL